MKLRQAIQSGGLVSVDVQGRAAVETGARLRAQISAKEIQIGAMKGYATPSNPDLQRAEQELAAMRQELDTAGIGSVRGRRREPVGDARGLGNIRLLREVKYQEVMFELLAKQYETRAGGRGQGGPAWSRCSTGHPRRRSGPVPGGRGS